MSSEPTTETTPEETEKEDKSGQIEPRRPLPGSLWVYICVVLLLYAIWGLVPGHPSLAIEGSLATTIFFRLLIVYLLVNRSTIGWILAIAFEVLYIVILAVIIEPPGNVKSWSMLFLVTVALALLLTRATRVHIRSGK